MAFKTQDEADGEPMSEVYNEEGRPKPSPARVSPSILPSQLQSACLRASTATYTLFLKNMTMGIKHDLCIVMRSYSKLLSSLLFHTIDDNPLGCHDACDNNHQHI